MHGLLNRGIWVGIPVAVLILVDLCPVGRVCFLTHPLSEIWKCITQQLAFRNRCRSGFLELKSHVVRLVLPSYPCFSSVHSSTILNLLLCIAGRLRYQTLPKTLPGVKRETGNSLSCPRFESGNSCLQYIHLSFQHLKSCDAFLFQGFVHKCA